MWREEDRSVSTLSYTVIKNLKFFFGQIKIFSLVFEDNFTYRILTKSGLAMVDPGPILSQLSELLSLIVLKFHPCLSLLCTPKNSLKIKKWVKYFSKIQENFLKMDKFFSGIFCEILRPKTKAYLFNYLTR